MSEEVIKIFDNISSRFGVVIDWTSENVIPYLQELFNKYVLCESIITLIWLILGIGCLIAGIIFIKKSSYEDYEFSIIFGLIGLIFGIIVILISSIHLIQYLTFPESLIIEKLK